MVTTTSKAFRASFSSVLAMAVMACQVVFAADQHRLELKDIPKLVGASELTQASDVAISPDGKWVAYTVTSKSLVTNETKQRLWLQPFEGGNATQIGSADADNSGPSWSPDSSRLLFYSASSGHTSVAIWNVAERETHVTNIAPQLPAQWLPDSTRFVVGISGEKQDQAQSSDQKSSTPVLFTTADTNLRLPGGHYLGLFPMNRWGTDSLSFAIVDARSVTGRTVARNLDTRLSEYQISPDGSKLLYTVTKGEFDYDGNNRDVYDINVLNLQDGSTTVVAEDLLGFRGVSPVWSHNGRMLAVVGGTVHDDAESLPLGSRMFKRPSHCYVIDLGWPTKLRAVGQRSFSRHFPPIWANDDTSIYEIAHRNETRTPAKIIKLNVATGATETALSMPPNTLEFEIAKGEQDNLYITDLNKGGENAQVLAFNLRSHQLTPIIEAKQAINLLNISAAGTHFAYLTVDSSHPANLWISERSTGKPHQLTHFDLSEEQQKKIGETRSVSWEFNGKTLYGTIWLPANYREGQRCPTIVDVYPGSQASGMRNVFRGDPFSDDLVWQAFSARGYAVFWPDFDLTVGEGPHEIAAQVLPGLDKIVAMGIADPERLAVHGRSWGGYSTYALITETQRFKAAIPSVGYSNAFTAYGELDDNSSPYVLGLLENDDFGVSPWQNRDLYIKNSPYFNFEKVTTPVLIQYGEKDRTFAWTSREAFVALRRLGKTATLLGYPDEGHGVYKPENQVDFTNRALDWFDQYLKPNEERRAAR